MNENGGLDLKWDPIRDFKAQSLPEVKNHAILYRILVTSNMNANLNNECVLHSDVLKVNNITEHRVQQQGFTSIDLGSQDKIKVNVVAEIKDGPAKGLLIPYQEFEIQSFLEVDRPYPQNSNLGKSFGIAAIILLFGIIMYRGLKGEGFGARIISVLCCIPRVTLRWLRRSRPKIQGNLRAQELGTYAQA